MLRLRRYKNYKMVRARLVSILRWIKFGIFWPSLFVYFLGSKRTRVLIRCGDEVLLVKDHSHILPPNAVWAMPGGGLHRSELPAVGAAREIAEELGVTLAPSQFVLLGTARISTFGLPYQALFLVITVSQKPVLRLQPSEIADAQWFSLTEVHSVPLRQDVLRALQLLTAN